MLQAVVLVMIIFIISIIWTEVKQHNPVENKKQKQGKVIDISGAWIDSSHLPYNLKPSLLTTAEQDLYHRLQQVLQNSNYVICPKVRMADFMDLSIRAENRQEYSNRIKVRKIDLLICELPSLRPTLAVTVGDKSSAKKDKLADRFTAHAIKAVKLAHLVYDRSNLPDERRLRSDLAQAGLIGTYPYPLSE